MALGAASPNYLSLSVCCVFVGMALLPCCAFAALAVDGLCEICDDLRHFVGLCFDVCRRVTARLEALLFLYCDHVRCVWEASRGSASQPCRGTYVLCHTIY
ncbi:hypothetical protein TcCL_NonESM09580 [Trypanosoma cruzi]|nr:hypothetical protein TcCL_NonESM09580 [Trypanosoma cruzi]